MKNDIWEELDKDGKPIGWVSKKPERFVSYIQRGTILLFSDIEKVDSIDIIKFLGVTPGISSITGHIEFTIPLLERLIYDIELLKFADTKDVKEVSITPSGTIVQDLNGWTYSHPVYLPGEVFFVMGEKEYKDSNGKVNIGQKIILIDIINIYLESI